MFVLRVEMYKLCSAIYRTTLFTTLTSTLTLYFKFLVMHCMTCMTAGFATDLHVLWPFSLFGTDFLIDVSPFSSTRAKHHGS